jgi:23S rRNA (cytidine1920-2'-O)/16S rRNA (cytidine1409-2'-O)-methyltransferase
LSAKTKTRLDQRLVEMGLADLQKTAQAMILAGEVYVDDQKCTKAGQAFGEDHKIEVRRRRGRFVSRGGEKLAGALQDFELNVQGFHCMDVGASTGGFTDCLLQSGAKKVFAIDVGRGQLDHKFHDHEQIIWKESIHVRELDPEQLPFQLDLIVMDVSFISLKKALPHVVKCMSSETKLLALIKPQFEVDPSDLAKGGVVKTEEIRREVLQGISDVVTNDLKLKMIGLKDSHLKGPKGNQETFLLAVKMPGHS